MLQTKVVLGNLFINYLAVLFIIDMINRWGVIWHIKNEGS